MAFGENIDPRGSRTSNAGLRILARSVFKELKRSGNGRAEMLAFANELLELVANDANRDDDIVS
ncbi:MAG: hypothetical protein R3A48_17665 [Polyangiales bacterium]